MLLTHLDLRSLEVHLHLILKRRSWAIVPWIQSFQLLPLLHSFPCRKFIKCISIQFQTSLFLSYHYYSNLESILWVDHFPLVISSFSTICRWLIGRHCFGFVELLGVFVLDFLLVLGGPWRCSFVHCHVFVARASKITLSDYNPAFHILLNPLALS